MSLFSDGLRTRVNPRKGVYANEHSNGKYSIYINFGGHSAETEAVYLGSEIEDAVKKASKVHKLPYVGLF